MSFTRKLHNSLGEFVYLVRGKSNGREAWHYIVVDKLKITLFKQALKSGSLNVSEYGAILYSGWGKNPPQHIVDAVKTERS